MRTVTNSRVLGVLLMAKSSSETTYRYASQRMISHYTQRQKKSRPQVNDTMTDPMYANLRLVYLKYMQTHILWRRSQRLDPARCPSLNVHKATCWEAKLRKIQTIHHKSESPCFWQGSIATFGWMINSRALPLSSMDYEIEKNWIREPSALHRV